MKIHLSRFSGLCAASACVLVLVAGSGAARADMTPTTGVNVQVIGGTTDVATFQDQQSRPLTSTRRPRRRSAGERTEAMVQPSPDRRRHSRTSERWV